MSSLEDAIQRAQERVRVATSNFELANSELQASMEHLRQLQEQQDLPQTGGPPHSLVQPTQHNLRRRFPSDAVVDISASTPTSSVLLIPQPRARDLKGSEVTARPNPLLICILVIFERHKVSQSSAALSTANQRTRP